MLQTLWPIIVNLAVTGATLRWFFRRQPRLRARAGAVRWTAVCIGLGLAVHAAIDTRSNPVLLEIMALAGLALAMNFLFFPDAASRLLRRFQSQGSIVAASRSLVEERPQPRPSGMG